MSSLNWKAQGEEQPCHSATFSLPSLPGVSPSTPHTGPFPVLQLSLWEAPGPHCSIFWPCFLGGPQPAIFIHALLSDRCFYLARSRVAPPAPESPSGAPREGQHPGWGTPSPFSPLATWRRREALSCQSRSDVDSGAPWSQHSQSNPVHPQKATPGSHEEKGGPRPPGVDLSASEGTSVKQWLGRQKETEMAPFLALPF